MTSSHTITPVYIAAQSRINTRQENGRILDRKLAEYGKEAGKIIDRKMVYTEQEEGRILDRRMAEYWIGRWQNIRKEDGTRLDKRVTEY
jgi:hypothetical protein